MATPNIVPRSDSEGGLGTASKYWASAYVDAIYLGAGFIGRDAHNLIDFSVDNRIAFKVNNSTEINLEANVLKPAANDGIGLGEGNKGWSDLHLASGAVINFNNGDVTATHSSNALTIAGGTFAISDSTFTAAAANSLAAGTDGTYCLSVGRMQNDKSIIAVGDIQAAKFNGIPFFTDAGNASMYTANVSATDDTAIQNTGYGFTSLDAVTTGDRNTAIGFDAGTAINTGADNTIVGNAAGDALTTGSRNVAIGKSALSNEDGHGRNIAIGYNALNVQNAGADAYNVAIGYGVGAAMSTGTLNTIVGGLSLIHISEPTRPY
mgnify:CR=1 FL=1